MTRLVTILTLLVLTMALAACSTTEAGTGTLSSDESPVPDGMPVMYEFYTES
ncbi:MAG: hypothetical protein Q7W51_04400 [Coriobacteriia bacterium]|nr:hypothetical protein [Coriobacteriia bacterium]